MIIKTNPTKNKHFNANVYSILREPLCRSFIFFTISLFIIGYTHAQVDFYYGFNNQKNYITRVSGKYLVEFPASYSNSEALQTAPFLLQRINRHTNAYIVLDTPSLSTLNIPYHITPAYVTNTGSPLYYTKDIVLKFKSTASEAAINGIVEAHSLSWVKNATSYVLYTSAGGDALQISKSIYQSGLVEFCTPSFLITVTATAYIPNDQFFNQQWYLHNTGQGTNDGKTTTPNADIDAPEAWDITKGLHPNSNNNSIIVSVIDQGVTDNHPDLPNSRQLRLNGSNVGSDYDGSYLPNNPSPTPSIGDGQNHGNACAGIIAATQDNNEGISGICPQCKIMPIKIPIASSSSNIPVGGINVPDWVYADAFDFAVNNGADVLSNSLAFYQFYPVIESAIQNATNNGKVVVFSIGNTANRIDGDDEGMFFTNYSCLNTKVIAVGASDRDNNQANYSPSREEVDIAAPSHTAFNAQMIGSSESRNIWTIDIPSSSTQGLGGYNPNGQDENLPLLYRLPLVGEELPSTGINYSAYTGRMGGTSASAPQVAGVAALMKSVNPCLSAAQIKDVLQLTADKVGGYNYNWNPAMPGHSKQLGYGKLNAYKAVKMAKDMYASGLDLYTKDFPEDIGSINSALYNNASNKVILSNSPDIWVRNQPDGLTNQVSEEPTFANNAPCYVYIRVRNKGCLPSNTTSTVSLYWSTSALNSSWPNHWDGTYPQQGNKIGTKNLPVLTPGESTVLEFIWTSSISNTVQAALLCKVDDVLDPINSYNGMGIDRLVGLNNNISIRNVVIKKTTTSNGVRVKFLAGNVSDMTERYDIKIEVPYHTQATTPKITDEAEVRFFFDPQGWEMLAASGQLNQEGIQVLENNQLILSKPSITFKNLSFPSNTRVPIEVDFNFLTDESTNNINFEYIVSQHYTDSPDIVLGSKVILIQKDIRTPFDADAGTDKTVLKNEAITISAQQIAELAEYHWYNEAGELIYTGKDLTVSPELTEKYKLEVISSIDGFKDYDEVQVTVKKQFLTTIAPNPASTSTTIGYDANGCTSAYIMLVPPFGTQQSSNYILTPANTQITLNTQNLGAGVYTVILVCDGKVVDAKALEITP